MYACHLRVKISFVKLLNFIIFSGFLIKHLQSINVKTINKLRFVHVTSRNALLLPLNKKWSKDILANFNFYHEKNSKMQLRLPLQIVLSFKFFLLCFKYEWSSNLTLTLVAAPLHSYRLLVSNYNFRWGFYVSLSHLFEVSILQNIGYVFHSIQAFAVENEFWNISKFQVSYFQMIIWGK